MSTPVQLAGEIDKRREALERLSIMATRLSADIELLRRVLASAPVGALGEASRRIEEDLCAKQKALRRAIDDLEKRKAKEFYERLAG